MLVLAQVLLAAEKPQAKRFERKTDRIKALGICQRSVTAGTQCIAVVKALMPLKRGSTHARV